MCKTKSCWLNTYTVHADKVICKTNLVKLFCHVLLLTIVIFILLILILYRIGISYKSSQMSPSLSVYSKPYGLKKNPSHIAWSQSCHVILVYFTKIFDLSYLICPLLHFIYHLFESPYSIAWNQRHSFSSNVRTLSKGAIQ